MGVTRLLGRLVGLVAALALPIGLAGSAGAREAAQAPKRILLLTHNLFYNHDNLETIEAVLPEWGKSAGFTVTSLEGYKQTARCERTKPCAPDVVDLSMINERYLAQFDAIVMSTNGELPLSDESKRALVDFVRGGKGILFLHQSMVTLYGWHSWGELLGGYLAASDMAFDVMNAAKRLAVLKVERQHPSTRGLPEHWTLSDEFPRFASKVWDPATPTENLGPTKLPVPLAFSRDRVTVVLSIDNARTDFAGAPRGWSASGDYPVAWYQKIGKGRTFYTSLGHRKDLWSDDQTFRTHVVGAIRWLLRLEA